MMTPEQESHLQSIKDKFLKDFDTKYRAGQLAHGGNLWDRDALADAIHEALDNVAYLYTLDYKHRQCISLMEQAICEMHGLVMLQPQVQSIKNLLLQAIEMLGENKTTMATGVSEKII